ncbi:hypothetical protein HETIRDRAFT_169013 [Heterobasidion irregulare TC 32-1]|uniref:Uncharacterized protein n=1 Tax=Heterobasidion irregulare (strain TC 32-1) TaxID=747525 RepID=W4K8C4_HETIT|nr:uncharacterized protein HETIRDRAFT_169013 [Heterobasidion irregulare TC 32-1]ETW82009.1 hypothetical protein HETIRDRAFT_169013 [Heterobasidion irregulare TC 32-1]
MCGRTGPTPFNASVARRWSNCQGSNETLWQSTREKSMSFLNSTIAHFVDQITSLWDLLMLKTSAALDASSDGPEAILCHLTIPQDLKISRATQPCP